MSFAPDQGSLNGAPRRIWAIAATGVVHVLVLLLVLVPLSAARPSVRAPNLITFDSATVAPMHASAPKPTQPKIVPPQPLRPEAVPPPLIEVSVVTPQVLSLLEQADAQSATGGCDLTAPVQAALRSSVAVQAELPRIPAERRSVANAIAIWNENWVEPDTQLNPEVLDTIRNAVATTVAAASEACRMQSQGGPRLIYLPVPGDTNGDTTILALGSGAWTWQQVADTAQPQVADGLSDSPVEPSQTRLTGKLPQLFKTAFYP